MGFAQLTYRERLRDIEACLRAVQSRLYHVGIRARVARSTVAEANETRPLDSYALLNARAGYRLGRWEIAGIVTNVFDSKRATFGTFNENRQTGQIERFLTPLSARAVRLIVRHEFGPRAALDGP